jgi:hypothetical protein|tara:strand:- start:176 stop:349 length:174 start_codon:yes stop_codon:yes gene_type:complete
MMAQRLRTLLYPRSIGVCLFLEQVNALHHMSGWSLLEHRAQLTDIMPDASNKLNNKV